MTTVLCRGCLRVSLACALALGGCALFGKGTALEPRYYSAERAPWPAAPVAVASQAPSPTVSSSANVALSTNTARLPGLRLGRISSSAHLRERIAYRSSARELGFYDTRRWTERPEAYLRRALASALFEERRLVRVVSGPAPTVDLELTDFDELLSPTHATRVRVRVVLTDQRIARFEHTFSAEQSIADERDFERVAEAMAIALTRCVEEISDRVVAELANASASLASGAPANDAR